jgi:hypothetical protein
MENGFSAPFQCSDMSRYNCSHLNGWFKPFQCSNLPTHPSHHFNLMDPPHHSNDKNVFPNTTTTFSGCSALVWCLTCSDTSEPFQCTSTPRHQCMIEVDLPWDHINILYVWHCHVNLIGCSTPTRHSHIFRHHCCDWSGCPKTFQCSHMPRHHWLHQLKWILWIVLMSNMSRQCCVSLSIYSTHHSGCYVTTARIARLEIFLPVGVFRRF